MMKRFFHIALFLGVLLNFGSCSEDLIEKSVYASQNDEGTLPLEFEFLLPDENPDTRGPEFPKRKFSSDDIIHIEGYFEMTEGEPVRKYGAMSYDEESKKWKPYKNPNSEVAASTLTWPNNAVNGTFKAYYISKSSYLLQQGNSTPDMSLSGITGSNSSPDTDPLQSVSNGEIEYGHTIILNFEHACAYLEIQELPTGVSPTNVFWLTREGADNNVSPEFYNAYHLSLSATNELSLDFVQVPNDEFNNAVYVAAEGVLDTDNTDRMNAGFYLAPGQYKSFVLGYPGTEDMTRYLTYTKKETDTTDPNDPNPDNDLKANGVYTFNVSKSTGITMNTPPEGTGWDETAPPYQKVDAEKFLWAICHNEDYYNEMGVHVIDGNNGTGPAKLLCNVDMDYQKYTVFPPSETNGNTWFDPSLGNDNVFEGGKHYIYNMGSPLFRQNNGVIRQLGICEAKIPVVSVESQNAGQVDVPYIYEGFDLSRNGVVCGFNTGTIDEIQIVDNITDYYSQDGIAAQLTVSVFATDAQEAHNVGIVAGSNSGTINNIRFSGKVQIEVENYTGNVVIDIPTVNIGGIIGQNVLITTDIGKMEPLTGRPNITDVEFSIKNNCNGPIAKYSIGGACGANNGGTLDNIIIPVVNIDSSKSAGLISTIGGLVGTQSSSNLSVMSSCTATGAVHAGKIENFGDLYAYNYIGGIAGLFYVAGNMNNCRAVVDVYGPSGDNYVGGIEELYGTGGAFGRIDDEQTGQGNLYDIISNGENLQGPPQYIGNFTGIAPGGKDWDYYNGFQIKVKSHTDIENIGGNID